MDQKVSLTKQFMVLREGRQLGPLKAVELRSRAREGAISPLDSVCAVGSENWVLGYQVKGLFPAWLAAEIKERLAKGEAVDDLLPKNPESSTTAQSAVQLEADDLVLAPLEDSGWYWLDEDKRFGPVDLDVMRSMLDSGLLPEQSQVARSEGGPWLAPRLFPELKPHLPKSDQERSPRHRSQTGRQSTPSRRMPVAGVVGLVAFVLFYAIMIPIMMLESGALSEDAIDVIAGSSRKASAAQTERPQRSHRESAVLAKPESSRLVESAIENQDPAQELMQTFVRFVDCLKTKLYDYLTDSSPGGGEGGPLLFVESFDLQKTASVLHPFVGEIRCDLSTMYSDTRDILLVCHPQDNGWKIVEVRAYGTNRLLTESAPSQVMHMIERAKAGDCR